MRCVWVPAATCLVGLCGTRHKTQRLTTDVAVMRPSGCQLPLSFIEKKKKKKTGIIFLNFASQLQNFAKGFFFSLFFFPFFLFSGRM